MPDQVTLMKLHRRMLIAVRYLNSSEAIFDGLKQQSVQNKFHFLVTVRSFVEYTRRGIWFLAWARDTDVTAAEHISFREAKSPMLHEMDAKINAALGLGKISHLTDILPGINESYIRCLHALTHGNPISVRMAAIGLDKLFNIPMMLARAEMELDLFRILLYRRLAGEELADIWKILAAINNKPAEVRTNAVIAAAILKSSGALSQFGEVQPKMT